ncbi:MAG: PPOX class F420-dependent oxidoreductase [Anaerolineales bacterium]
MNPLIPSEYHDLLADDNRAFAFLATIMPDGAPQVTPVWFNTQDEYILVNSALGRVKDRNMRARPKVALTIMHPKNPYRYLEIRGTVVHVAEEGARQHIDALAKKYTGQDTYTFGPPDEVRVTYKILPERVHGMG